jgi:hypothetical protein
MSDVMSSTATKSPKPVRRAVGAVLIPVERFEAWYARASATPGLNDIERRVLDAIREWHRRLYVEEFAGSLSYRRMAQRLDTDSVNVRWAVDRLVELGLIGVVRGAGARANHYLPALPKRVVTAMTAAAADVPPF